MLKQASKQPSSAVSASVSASRLLPCVPVLASPEDGLCPVSERNPLLLKLLLVITAIETN